MREVSPERNLWISLLVPWEYVVQGESETFLVFFWGIYCARGVGDSLGIFLGNMLCKGSWRLFEEFVVQGEPEILLGFFWGICCARGVGDFLGIFWGIFNARGVGDFLGIFWGIFCARGVEDFLGIFWGTWMQTTL
jgi:hypothetical protein